MTETLGLFPLGTVLVPGERLPLHIFEPRYRELIGECLERSQPFGFIRSHGDQIGPVGTRAAVTEVLTRHPDGTFDIVVAGGRRFHLVELTAGRSFITGRVEDFEDLPDPATPDEAARCRQAFDRLLVQIGADPAASPLPSDDEALAFAIAAVVELPPALKQELLASRSERDRVRLLTEALTGPVTEDLRGREIARRAAANGHVTKD
ncbi:MAG TPA: LON peptidase substrate-binding domain-containing protein [Actinomycetota bacterium]|nr:LON peptidase substrate-binding domain-containing protein [Actinomycetota bacterium]